MAFHVRLLPAAEREFATIPRLERRALESAFAKLEAIGPTLGAPHSSSVAGASATLRELRPRQGRSPWRAFYRRVGDEMIVAAIGPEAAVDRRGFDRAVLVANERLAADMEERNRR